MDHMASLMVEEKRALALKDQSKTWPSWVLKHRQLCDLELLLLGAFHPLQGFLNEEDYTLVCREMRLSSGALWPMPIVLDVTEAFAASLSTGDSVALRTQEGIMLAVLHIESMWQPDVVHEAEQVFGTTERGHPGVAYLFDQTNPVYIGGRIEGVSLPKHYDFPHLRLTPKAVRAHFAEKGWDKVVAFQTRNPMHKAHWALTQRAMEELGAALLLHPVVGATKPGDVDHYTRVRCYQAVLPYYEASSVQLSLLPLAMRMGGPREAIWHGLIRKNYGATHFIVGRDHAGPGNDAAGNPFYGPYDAQALFQQHEQEMGIKMVPFAQMVYSKSQDGYVPVDGALDQVDHQSLSGTQLRQRLKEGQPIPTWFTFPEVASVLQHRYPPRLRQGVTLFFTGLSGSGKSTIANILEHKLMAEDHRLVSLFDGDEVRHHLSSELGFSRKDRCLNVQRIAYVASLATRHGGLAICAPIAPYDEMRKRARSQIEAYGGFVLIHVSTPLEECEARDIKGLYAKARAGLIDEFTGISDPYEVPDDADIVLDTINNSAEACANEVMAYLQKEGYCAFEHLKERVDECVS